MRIQHNIMAMNAYRNYNTNTSALAKNLEKLSSGYKINRAGDDAAGLAISEKMRAQITGLNAAQKNVKDGVNLVKTAEGALQEVQDMLNRMDYLATQSANGTYDNPVDRFNLQKEVDALKDEIDRIADSANFNGIKLLDGTMGERNTTVDTSVANGVQRISIMGGGNGAASTVAITGATASVSAGGTVTLTLAASVTGVKWVAISPKDGMSAEKGGTTHTASLKGDVGGSVTFKAVVDRTVASAKAKDMEYYDGMTITVSVAAKSITAGGGYGAYSTGTVTVQGAGDGGALTLQIGDTADKYNQMQVAVKDLHVSSLGIGDVNIGDLKSAQAAIQSIKDAINTVSSTRGDLGAIQNRLEHTQKNLSVMTENIQDAESAIRDTDVAEEMMAYTKNNILIQSAQAMLAQANAVPQGVLQLLG